MEYKKLKSQHLTEDELRKRWKDEYCNVSNEIVTFDRIVVKFYENMFDHSFYESEGKRKGDKSILSLNRCEKMLWIKDTLQDSNSILKQGWLKEKKCYTKLRRVALIKGNYIVVIALTNKYTAKFVTAYEINDEDNLKKILKSPDWVP